MVVLGMVVLGMVVLGTVGVPEKGMFTFATPFLHRTWDPCMKKFSDPDLG
jgi:hypothetical protein